MGKLVLKTDHSIEMVGTLETLSGMAVIQGAKADGDGGFEPEYSGTTEVYWDEQKTVLRNGRRVYVDESGHEYTEDQLELIED